MTCYNSSALIGRNSDWRANLVKDFKFLIKINFPPMRALEFITGHVIYNQIYNYKFQLKIRIVSVTGQP